MVLSLGEVQLKMREINNWDIEGTNIIKEFEFRDFKSALEFVNKIAEIAERHNHHPTILFDYRLVRITLTTHSEKGLTEKDFEFAKEVDKIR